MLYDSIFSKINIDMIQIYFIYFHYAYQWQCNLMGDQMHLPLSHKIICLPQWLWTLCWWEHQHQICCQMLFLLLGHGRVGFLKTEQVINVHCIFCWKTNPTESMITGAWYNPHGTVASWSAIILVILLTVYPWKKRSPLQCRYAFMTFTYQFSLEIHWAAASG